MSGKRETYIDSDALAAATTFAEIDAAVDADLIEPPTSDVVRFVVELRVSNRAMSAADRAPAALEWVTSVFRSGGLETSVKRVVRKLTGSGSQNELIAVSAVELAALPLAPWEAE